MLDFFDECKIITLSPLYSSRGDDVDRVYLNMYHLNSTDPLSLEHTYACIFVEWVDPEVFKRDRFINGVTFSKVDRTKERPINDLVVRLQVTAAALQDAILLRGHHIRHSLEKGWTCNGRIIARYMCIERNSYFIDAKIFNSHNATDNECLKYQMCLRGLHKSKQTRHDDNQ